MKAFKHPKTIFWPFNNNYNWRKIGGEIAQNCTVEMSPGKNRRNNFDPWTSQCTLPLIQKAFSLVFPCCFLKTRRKIQLANYFCINWTIFYGCRSTSRSNCFLRRQNAEHEQLAAGAQELRGRKCIDFCRRVRWHWRHVVFLSAPPVFCEGSLSSCWPDALRDLMPLLLTFQPSQFCKIFCFKG